MRKPGQCRAFFGTLHGGLDGKRMQRIFQITASFFVLLTFSVFATDHEGGRNFPLGSGGVNAPYQQDKPYFVMISIDGFRWDYLDKYPSPAMNQLAGNGVRAERLLPVFPTL